MDKDSSHGTCFLFGHRDAPESLLPAVEAAVEHCVDAWGVTEFVVGQYGGFDRLAARAVQHIRRRRPEIALVLLLPYLPTRPIPAGYDGSLVPDGMERVPRRFAIVRANRYAVDRCDALIVHVAHPGNSARLLVYAKSRKVHIVNLADSH